MLVALPHEVTESFHYRGFVVMIFFSFSRLVEDEERRWTDENIDMVALKHFPNIDKEKAMSRPILYSNWLSKVINSNRIVWEQLTDVALLPILTW